MKDFFAVFFMCLILSVIITIIIVDNNNIWVILITVSVVSAVIINLIMKYESRITQIEKKLDDLLEKTKKYN